MSDLARELLTVELPPPAPPKGEREYHAFLRLLPELLKTYRGRYVAVHDGGVIESSEDDIELIWRVHERVGYVPIHVGLVTDEPRVIRIPHNHEFRPRALEAL